MIDRDSPVPVYYQIQQDLINRIRRGEWQIGQQMPSESSLIDEYKVSRVTLRQALAELEKDNLIKRHRGKGAFITGTNPKPFVYDLNYKMVSGDGVDKEGDGISAEVLDIKYVSPAYPEIKAELKLSDDNASAVYLKRLFFLRGKPIAIGRSWLPAYMLPGLVEKGLVNCSVTDTLRERYNIIPKTVDDYVEVVRCSQSDSILLKCTLDVPLLLVKGKSSLEDSRVVEYSETNWLGDYVRFHLHFKSTDNGYIMGN